MNRIKNQDSVLGGVCLGLADELKTDVTLIRVVFVILFFTPLPVGIAYLVLWVVLPKTYSTLSVSGFNNENSDNNLKTKTISTMSNHNRNGNMVGGLILIILGAIFSFKTFFDINLFSYVKNLWPLILIGLGVWIIVKDKDDDNNVNNTTNTGTGY
ncbi:MAG: PspC domain-containing protein [Cytophagaceae bacterium]|nr:PspC domain-containing protein [Cytophagaceae bacterium]MBK9936091.1 PspC domain-containing protein [Cytophagaceae bacterium]MBL0304018.1 PspC domain-containing protein [Cytophagaceae bacterium]MBL0326832.1 PspC domain-containing protein [Cytophagaceae bacterium]